MIILKRFSLFLIAFLIGLPSFSYGKNELSSANDCLSTHWPHEISDLQPHPDVLFGRFDNGLRFVIKENSYPANRVGMFLYVGAGSLHETEEQRGAAHYLEHMLFNGSTHFKPGELVKYFQKIGMDFGGDTNAYTTYDETVYNIVLPSAAKEDLDKGLLVMSDYARGALLLESEVERERGVILAEKRTRDSAVQRVQIESSKVTLSGTKIPERSPIGTLESLNSMDSKILKSFYDAWYRPENIVLIIVGDFERKTLLPLVEKYFAGLKGEGAKAECPVIGTLDTPKVDMFYYHEPAMGVTNVSIESFWQEKLSPDTQKLQVKELEAYVVSMLLNSRLRKMMEESEIPFTSASFYEGDLVGQLKYAGIGAATTSDKWKETLKILENVIRQVATHGIEKSEFESAKKRLLSHLKAEVLTESSMSSTQIAQEIIRSINKNRVYLSRKQELDFYTPALKSLTLEDIENRFNKLWSHGNKVIEVIGDTYLERNGKDQISKTYYDAIEQPVKKWIDEEKRSFPYLEPYEIDSDIITSEENFEDIDSSRITFKNGIIINFKNTNYQKNRINVRVDIGAGKLAEEQPGMALLAESVVKNSGFGGLDKSEVEEVLAGTNVTYDFSINSSSFTWFASALKGEEEKLFQVLQTLIADPGFKKDAFESAQKRYSQAYASLTRNLRGGMRLHVKKFLAGGEKSIGWPSHDELEKISYPKLSEWFKRSMVTGVLEVSIVGDFRKDNIITLAKKYLGGLPENSKLDKKNKVVSFPSGKDFHKQIDSSINKSLLVLAWPTDDFWNIKQTRRLNMLAKIFDDRLRVVIREKLGEAYSPVVYNYSSKVHRGYGFIPSRLVVEPDKVEVVRDSVLKITDDLKNNGVTEEEFSRAKAPTLTALKEHIKKNSYWLNTVLAKSSTTPEQLKWPTTILSDFGAITKEDINQLASRYLINKNVATAIISP